MKAKSVSILIEAPVSGRNRNEPKIEMGIPKVVQKASLGSRKIPNNNKTRTKPRKAFFTNRLTRSR